MLPSTRNAFTPTENRSETESSTSDGHFEDDELDSLTTLQYLGTGFVKAIQMGLISGLGEDATEGGTSLQPCIYHPSCAAPVRVVFFAPVLVINWCGLDLVS